MKILKMSFLAGSMALAGMATAQDGDATAQLQEQMRAMAQDEMKEISPKDGSYALGVQVGQELSANFPAVIDMDSFIEGLSEALKGEELNMSQDELAVAQQAFMAQLQQAQMEEQAAAATQAQSAGQQFLAENKAKEGVEVTASGLQYEVIEAGEGESPEPTDVVVVNYEGRLLSGEVFDSSYQRNQPAEFQLNRVIPGWTEGLQLMEEGSKYRFYIPSDLAYGERGAGGRIGPHETLIFEVELLEVKEQAANAPGGAAPQ